jgi:hypothetical protein
MIRPPSKETCVLVLGLAILVGGLGSRSVFRVTDGVKNVSVSPASFDFGKARQDKTLEHVFRLSNGGDVPIVITKTESSCSCTTTEGLEGRSIAPGQGADVAVTLKTGPGAGPEAGQITLYFRSASHADAPVHFTLARVTTDVVPDYRVRPTLIDFGTVDHLDAVSRTVRLRPEALTDVKIVRLSCTQEAFSARPIDAPTGDRDLHVEVTFSGRPLWKSGAVEAMASIETTSTGSPITQVLARARFVAPVEVEPTSIVVGSGTTGPVEREIRIDAARSVRIAALRSTDPAIRLVAIGPPEGRTLRVKSTIAGDDPHHAIDAEVSIDLAPTTGTVATEARTVKIPIHRLASKE